MNTVYHAVAAMAANRAIGKDNGLPWPRIPGGLKFFKELAMGHSVIMGRKTWDSLGQHAPLPGRQNIVLSRNKTRLLGALVRREVTDLSSMSLGNAFVIGGSEIYRLFLPWCESVYLTVLTEAYEGDAFVPEFESDFPHYTALQSRPDAEWRHYTRTPEHQTHEPRTIRNIRNNHHCLHSGAGIQDE